MRLSFLLFTALFAILLCWQPAIAKPKAKKQHVEKHANGKVRLQVPLVDNKWHGLCEIFDRKGQRLETCDYHTGERDGLRRVWKGRDLVTEEVWSMGQLFQPMTANLLTIELRRLRALPPRQGEDRQRVGGLRELQAVRMMCGVPWQDVRMTTTGNTYADLAAEICQAIGRLSHDPDNPGWDNDKFNKAHHGARCANLAMNSAWNSTFDQQFRQYIHDKGVKTLGHRRHCLNPWMNVVGIGAAGPFAAMYWGERVKPNDFTWDFHALPAPGVSSRALFDPSWDWHIAWGDAYGVPPGGSLTLTVHHLIGRLKPGTPWTECFKERELLRRESVAISTYGMLGSAAITAPPKRVPNSGFLRIRLTGLVDRSGKPRVIEYVTELVP